MQLHGLSPLQIEICDQLWKMQTAEQITSWFDALPRNIKPTALGMIMMLNVQAIDDAIDEAGELDVSDAEIVINHIRSL
jgi:hypothetical protein